MGAHAKLIHIRLAYDINSSFTQKTAYSRLGIAGETIEDTRGACCRQTIGHKIVFNSNDFGMVELLLDILMICAPLTTRTLP